MIALPETNALPVMSLQDVFSVIIISHKGWTWMQAGDAKK